jgi:hypothetical protein
MDRGFLFHEISNRVDKSWNWIEYKYINLKWFYL